jgi:hypothetical protein
VQRTPDNDNDKADKYFQTPSELVKRKDAESRSVADSEGNAFIEKLKQQSEDNREKNELLVQQKTMLNDVVSGASCSKIITIWRERFLTTLFYTLF